MIKSPEKQQNAYRILKVLSNQDYLAIDYSQSYFILSPVKSRYNLKPKSRSIQIPSDEFPKILKPKECILIDHIYYHVFAIGQHQVTCANSVDFCKSKNKQQIFYFLADAVRSILKHLLMKQANEVKKIIDIKNAIIINGQLYMLELDRGKIYPRSLQKSERCLIQFNQNDSFRKVLENELKIIKYFGLFLWEILYKIPYELKRQKIEVVEESDFTKELLRGMISKKITYEYLCIRMREEQGKKTHLRDKKLKKLNFLSKKQPPRYRTESMNSGERYSKMPTLSGLSGAFTPTYQETTPLADRKRRVITEIKTGEESIQTFPNKPYKFSHNQRPRFRLASIYRSTKEKTFKESESIISIDTHHKLSKQNEIAKNLFQKFVEARFNLRREKDEEISENLRYRLISKIQRFKTQHKSHSREKAQAFSLSHKNISANLSSKSAYEPEAVTKKLNFESQQKLLRATTLEDVASQQNRLRQTNAESTKDEKSIPIAIKECHSQPKESLKIESAPNQESNQQQMKEQIEFEIIRFSQIRNSDSFFLDKIEQDRQDNNAEGQTIENMPKTAQRINKPEDIAQNSISTEVQKKQKQAQFMKRRRLIQTQKQSNDEIEVVTIKKTQVQKLPQLQLQEKKSVIIANQPKSKTSNIDSLIQAIEEYQSFISILGDFATRVIKSKNQFKGFEWQKPIYFIYQRFIYERDRFQEALLLGARQLIRKNRSASDEQWDSWLISQHRKQLIQKIKEENKLLRVIFNNYSAKVSKQAKFQRKIDFYIRNRQKVAISQKVKCREVFVKFACKQIIEIYNEMIENEISSKQMLNFIQDCVYGCFIMAELDNRLVQPRYVKLSDYRRYSHDLDSIDLLVEQLYSLYFQPNDRGDEQF